MPCGQRVDASHDAVTHGQRDSRMRATAYDPDIDRRKCVPSVCACSLTAQRTQSERPCQRAQLFQCADGILPGVDQEKSASPVLGPYQGGGFAPRPLSMPNAMLYTLPGSSSFGGRAVGPVELSCKLEPKQVSANYESSSRYLRRAARQAGAHELQI